MRHPPLAKIAGQSLEMPRVDDSPVVRADLGVGTIKLPQHPRKHRHPLFRLATRHPHMIRCHAGLPGIQPFAPGNPPRGQFQRSIRTHKARRPPPQLQGHRRQVPRGGGHHLAAHHPSTGIKHHVKPLLQQGFCHPLIPRHTCHHLRRKHLGNQAAQNLGTPRRKLGRFHHRPASRRQCPHQRGQNELDRIVPRTQNQGIAIWLLFHPAGRRPGHERRGPPLGLHPTPQSGQGMADLPGHIAHLGGEGLGGRFAQILPQGLQQILLPPLQPRQQAAQPLAPLRLPRRTGRNLLLAHARDEGWNFHKQTGLSGCAMDAPG